MKKVEYMTGKFPFRANSRTNTNLDTKGTVKFMIEAMTDRILGVHNIDPNASEIIAEATLAVECGASSQEASNHCVCSVGRVWLSYDQCYTCSVM